MRDDCTPPKCGELSEYTDSAHTEVEDHSLECMNGSNVYDRYGHDTRQLHPSWQNEACSHRTVPIILPSRKDILAD